MNIALLDESLRAAGVPIHGVQLAAGVPSIDYAPEATPEQRAAGEALLAAWDDAAEEARGRRERAKKSLASDDLRALRGVMRAVHDALAEVRRKAGLPPQPWPAFLADVRRRIDAEANPEA